MASNKIKFKMSVEKIEFEFEGDYEQGRAMQQGITQTLTNLSNLQNRVLGAPAQETNLDAPKQIESKVVDSPRPRRRKRRALGTSDGAAAGENGDGSADANGEEAMRRSTGVSPTALMVELRKAGFFAQPRTSGEVLDELHRKGYSVLRANHLTYPFTSLTRQDVLRRDHDDARNQWAYSNGTKDEPDRG